jgi:hypothetical protein
LKAILILDGQKFEADVISFDFGLAVKEYPMCGLMVKSNCEEFEEIFLKRMKFLKSNHEKFILED